VSTEVSCHAAAFERRTLLVDLRLCSHHDSRDAESTLQSAARGKRRSPPLALVVGKALECGDVATRGLVERRLARHDGFAIDKYRAAAALAAR
jgi:hypothetical protein